MRRELSTEEEGGCSRLVFEPSGSVSAGMVMLHGLGGHAARHDRVLSCFSESGIAVVAPDLPGHGKSPGKRGHIPRIELVDTILRGAFDRVKEIAPDGPWGIGGHSMGALLVLDHCARGACEKYAWAWLSSALLEPAHGKPGWLYGLCRGIDKLWPSLTISSGVRRDACYDPAAVGITADQERASGTHRRISIRLGMELLRAARRVERGAGKLFADIPVLMTHGEADTICPMQYARALFDVLPARDKEFLTITDARHEPWHDPELVATVCRWMRGRVGSPSPA